MNADPETPSRWSGLDRWLEPPLRALLTWMALAAVTGVLRENGVFRYSGEAANFLIDELDWAFPARLPIIRTLFESGNVVLLMLWFQPIMLRLGLLRWVLWMGSAVLIFVGQGIAYDLLSEGAVLSFLAYPILAALLLIGRRSRPWLSLPAGILSLMMVVVYETIPHHRSEKWSIFIVGNLPFAAVMLYGTRPLPRRTP